MVETKVPSTFLSSSTVVGRIYGQDIRWECLFDVVNSEEGVPVIQVRIRNPWVDAPQQKFQMPFGVSLLVQIFEQPEVLWLAHATLFGDEKPMIIFAPVEPLESADGRSEMPALAAVTPGQLAEGLQDAARARGDN